MSEIVTATETVIVNADVVADESITRPICKGSHVATVEQDEYLVLTATWRGQKFSGTTRSAVKRGLYAAWLAVDVERLQKQYPWADIVAAEKV